MTRWLFVLLLLCGPALAQPVSYEKRPEVRSFIREIAARHGFVEKELRSLFARVERAEPVLEAIRKPPEPPVWSDYRALFLTDKRIQGGLEFWQAHQAVLERAEREYGVPAQVTVAIIGVETFYGRNTGRWRVIDALTTLAFDYPPRSRFFRSELEHYLVLARDNGQDVLAVRGSYAGAIGIPQFMPSSTRAYAVDFDGDGVIDLRASTADAIGSVASFLSKHGWQPGAPVQLKPVLSGEAWRAYAGGSVDPKHPLSALREAGVQLAEAPSLPEDTRAALIDLGSELRVGLRNFYVITRYNRSALYAAAVADLAEALRAAPQSPGR
jgi:membrane-bound lytic murein transglycosylase B